MDARAAQKSALGAVTNTLAPGAVCIIPSYGRQRPTEFGGVSARAAWTIVDHRIQGPVTGGSVLGGEQTFT
jgi:hypothetical protein